MKRVIICLGITLALSLASCSLESVSGNGQVTTDTRIPGYFKSVSSELQGNIHVVKGDEKSISITTDSNLMDYIETVAENGTLTVKTRDFVYLNRYSELDIVIVMPELASVSNSGTADMTIDPFSGDTLSIDLSGTGDISGDIGFQSVSVRIAGTGNVTLTGFANTLDALIAGTGNIQMGSCQAIHADVGIAGTGSATVRVSNSLDADISGIGSIRYYGNPSVTKSVAGLGHVEKLD